MAYAAEVFEAPSRAGKTSSYPIPRCSGAKARAILNRPTLPDHPIVFTDVMDRAPAMHKWTRSFFGEHYGWISKVIQGRTVLLGDQVRNISTSTPDHPAPYPFRVDIQREAPELLSDLEPFVRFGRTDRTLHPLMPQFLTKGTVVHELFFGGRGGMFPVLHQDLLGMHTQITQVLGDKEMVFFDPAQTSLMHTDPECRRLSLVDDPFVPDLSRFPGFAKARSWRVRICQGETIFFPAGWWHSARMDGPSISYGRAVVNDSNWDRMMQENFTNWRGKHPVVARPAYTVGKALGAAFRSVGR